MSVYFRPNMSPAQIFNYLIASGVNKTPAAIDGLQYSDKNHENGVNILKKNSGKDDHLSEAHVN